MKVTYRQPAKPDAESIAQVFRRTRESSLPYLPVLHTAGEDIDYFRNHVLTHDEVWVAETESRIIGFCAFAGEWLNHLYVEPEAQRSGIGSRLLNIVLSQQRNLSLWVFQQNTAAIRFYEMHGFRLVKKTNGAENEERVPDALYRFDAK